jgi:hypothetical protein
MIAFRAMLNRTRRSSEQARQRRYVLRRRFSQYPMAEIEDPTTAGKRQPEFSDSPFERRTADEQQNWVEVPLNGDPQRQTLAREALRYSSVYPDRIDSGLVNVALVERARTPGETNDRTLGVSTLQLRDNRFCRLDNPTPEFRLGKNTRPGIEELYRLCARGDR